MKRFFPQGAGTRFSLALLIVFSYCYLAVISNDIASLKDLAVMVVAFYFTMKAMTPSANGVPKP